MPMTPIARPVRPLPFDAVAVADHAPREVGEVAHAVDVVAVVDDDPHPADLEVVEPARRLEERGRERPQALPDVVQVGAGRPRRGRGGERVRHVHPRPAAERRRDEVRVQHGHGPRAVAEHDLVALGRVADDERGAAAAA